MKAAVAIVGGGPAGLALAGILERKGIDYIVYERSRSDTPPRGGCLDLHVGSGQRAIKEAGVFENFTKYGRGGFATVHVVHDKEGNEVFRWGEGKDSPEIDRSQLKKVLLSAIPAQKVKWSMGVVDAARRDGKVVLTFDNGSTASGWKLVVGADGVFSKIRHLVTSAKPQFQDIVFVTMFILPSNPYYEELESRAGQGPLVVLGNSKKIWIQRQGDGHYRIDYGFLTQENFPNGDVDLSDDASVKKFLLQHFASHTEEVQGMIKAGTGQYRPWPLYSMLPECLSWCPSPAVTLIGDAARVTTPFVGDGVNCAMRDSVLLAQELIKVQMDNEEGLLSAIAEYEKAMLPFAVDLAKRSIASGELYMEKDSPRRLLEDMRSAAPMLGKTDNL